ncbi:SIS domain-containing protein [Microbacterium lacticum]|uniref:D-sedoheptulose-7-phosphate isomerase n=1 Tax=Microbacterium lacticum TaxID=33885 RepID=UPI001F586519|nr:SIS domain-containing protein [Microbacterium lacticum]
MTMPNTTATQTVVRGYARDLRDAVNRLPIEQIAAAVDLIASTLEQERAVFIVGNGGSATTAQHMAADLCAAWGALGRTGSVSCLNDNTARWSALANDDGPDHAFAGQLRFLARRNDLLVTISVSAESPNLVAASHAAQEIGLRTLSLGGRRGRVATMADVSVEVGDGDYGIAEDLHLCFNHCLARYLRGGPHRYWERAHNAGAEDATSCAASSQ